MRCDGFTPEGYGLFSLGSLDSEEAIEIASHLEQQCETCVREVRWNLAFWTAYGEAMSPSVAGPRRRNWRAILLPISESSGRYRSWPKWGAAAAAIALACGITGWMVSVFNAQSRHQLRTQITTLEQRAQELTRERDQAIRAPVRTPSPAAPLPQAAVAQNNQRLTQEDNRLRQNLATSQQALSSAQQSLTDAQREVVQLQTQLSQQQTELASLRSAQTALQARAANAENSSAQALRQATLLQQRITQLEAERTRLVNLIQLRERQSQQNLRLVADLAEPGTRVVPLAGTESAPRARGYAVITADNRITFYQAGLPSLPANRTYQIWLIRNRGVPVVSGGLFVTNGARQTQLELTAGSLANNLTGIAVTSEPSGGSNLPTGNKLLIGTVRQS